MECKLQTYNLEHDPKTNIVINYSLVQMTNVSFLELFALHPTEKSLALTKFNASQQWIATLKKTEQVADLPPGFAQKDPQVVQLVHKIVHDFIKSDKGNLCGCVSPIA
jgi:hypothetical protein